MNDYSLEDMLAIIDCINTIRQLRTEKAALVEACQAALDIFIETSYPADEGAPAMLRAALALAGVSDA